MSTIVTSNKLDNVNRARRLWLAASSLAVSACASNALLHSEKHVASTPASTALNVIYLERNLLPSGAAANGLSQSALPVFAKFGYFEIGPKMIEFGPAMFKQNSLAGSFKQLPAVDFDLGKQATNATGTNTLVLEFKQGRVLAQGMVRTITLMLNVTLHAANSDLRLWSAQFDMHLGNDPALGLAKTTNVDQAFIEGLLALVLEQMNKERLVALKADKAMRPSAGV